MLELRRSEEKKKSKEEQDSGLTNEEDEERTITKRGKDEASGEKERWGNENSSNHEGKERC